jgi:eukaryotic-like serine/threonine-protein kinase
LTAAPQRSLIGVGSLFEVTLLREDGRSLVEKRLLSRFRREPEGRAALAREGRVLATVKHPALPELVRVGADDKGPFLVETFVAGASIRQIVEAWSARGGVAPRLAAHMTREAFRVLAELAELAGQDGPLGFVHGDIAPDHVLLSPMGEVRLLDFGAARVRDLPRSLLGEGRGTLPFVAPEVARGEAAPSVASDVYALAATSLFLASGGPICDAKDEAAMLLEIGTRGVRAGLCDAAAAFRPAEREALTRALALDPSRRITSPAEVLAAFDA